MDYATADSTLYCERNFFAGSLFTNGAQYNGLTMSCSTGGGINADARIYRPAGTTDIEVELILYYWQLGSASSYGFRSTLTSAQTTTVGAATQHTAKCCDIGALSLILSSAPSTTLNQGCRFADASITLDLCT